MLHFTKMHGLGNDYIYINALETTLADPVALAVKMSDRHFGIGGDGIVLIAPSQLADVRMRMFNADGSEAEMCGNAIRCVGKYLYDHRIIQKSFLSIETLAGIKYLQLGITDGKVDFVRVDMGEPILESVMIPVSGASRQIISEPITVNQHQYLYTAVSMGNPHCVIFVPEVTTAMVLEDGPLLEKHPYFPRKTNVEFVKLLSRQEVLMRVWERGSGETLACGTGAAATTVAAILNHLTDPIITVQLKGGALKIEWDQKTNKVFMTGPAIEVFEGDWLL